MSGCPVRCKFCATGNMKRYRNLTAEEIVEQVEFAINKAGADPSKAKEFKTKFNQLLSETKQRFQKEFYEL